MKPVEIFYETLLNILQKREDVSYVEERNTMEDINFTWLMEESSDSYNVSWQDYTPPGFEW